MFYKPFSYEFVDLSFAEGVSGVLHDLIVLQNNPEFSSNINLDLTQLIQATLNSILYFQRDDYLWKRQVDFNDDWLDHLIEPIIISDPIDNETEEYSFFNMYNLTLIGLLIILIIYNVVKEYYSSNDS